MSGNRERILAAASEIEEMAAEMKGMVIELRENPEDVVRAYALVYAFRTRFGRNVVNKLGVGLPRMRKRS